MSAAEQVQTEAPAEPPAPQLTELERARAEDPEFPIVLAKARARARGEEYDPEKHLPKEGKRRIDDASAGLEDDLEAIIGRFKERAARHGRHLRAVDSKLAAANDAS